ncbi:MMPL family transporter [Streptomyces mauvecolor]
MTSGTAGADSQREPTERAPANTAVMARLARWCVRRRVAVLTSAAVLLTLFALAAGASSARWSNGGYIADHTPAATAEQMAAAVGFGTPDLTFYIRADRSVDAADLAPQGRGLTALIATRPGVVSAKSYWTTQRPDLRSRDGKGAVIRVVLAAGEARDAATARGLVRMAVAAAPSFRVNVTGPAWVTVEATEQSRRDLLRCELVTGPLTALILLVAFGSLAAALLPLLTGALAVGGALAALSALTYLVPVSVFSTNICAALGFGLAVDYSLFILARYREEISRGASPYEAVQSSMATAGRTVAFSAAAVTLCLSALFVFPLELLRSLAYASVLVVLSVALTTLLVLPALIAVIGPRLDALDPLARLRPRRSTVTSRTWRRIATAVTARPGLWAAATTVLLLTLALPFAHARFTTVDEKILPATASSLHTADQLRADFTDPPERLLTVLLPQTNPVTEAAALNAYARRLSALPGAARVLSENADYRHGRLVPGTTRAARAPRLGTLLGVVSATDPQAPETVDLLRGVRTEPAPGPRYVAGRAAQFADTTQALAAAVPYWLAFMLAGTLVVVYLFTRSLLVPVKAAVMGMLSLTATLGVLVFVFQEGHLRSVVGDFRVSGSLESTMPLLTVAIAYGLSQDYEVFLLSRIKEEYDTTADNRQSIIFGIEHTGRLFTAAALIVASAMAALALSHITLLKIVGVGLAVAVLVDATVVRGILVPALLQMMGRANWWNPSLRPGRRAGLRNPRAER